MISTDLYGLMKITLDKIRMSKNKVFFGTLEISPYL